MDRIIAAFLESLEPSEVAYLEQIGAAAYSVAYLEYVGNVALTPRSR